MGALVGTSEEVRASYRGQQMDVHDPADLAVRADPDRTVEILVNLIDNAAKYSPESAAVSVTWLR